MLVRTAANVLAIAPIVLVACAGVASAQQFRWLNDALPAAGTSSELNGISGNGQVAVGFVVTSPTTSRAVRWSLADATATLLPDPATGQEAVANAISGDGSFVVGDAKFSPLFFEAAEWDGTNAPFSLGGTVPGGFFGSSAFGVSDDGSTIVGTKEAPGFLIRACYWQGGTLFDIGASDPAGIFSVATDATTNGAVIVGSTDAVGGGTPAFRWRAGDGFVLLPDIAGGATVGEARAITSSGTVSVGFGTGTLTTVAVRWIHANWAVQGWAAADTLEVLGDFPGGPSLSAASGVSDDGTIAVGYGTPATGQRAAAIWFGNQAPTDLKQFAESSLGVSLGEAQLIEARAISADGQVIVGFGRRGPTSPNEGWVLDLRQTGPQCPVCAADFDQDGGVTGADIEAFFVAFESGGACGDTDQDGGITGADIEAFFTAFEAGGC
jgi:uncharacterized membrane protein